MPGLQECILTLTGIFMHQSIPAVPIPLGNRGEFAYAVNPGVGHSQFYRGLGTGICVPWGDPRTFDAHVFESAMDELSGKDKVLVEQCLICQGLEKLLNVFKGMCSQFWIFLHLLEMLNVKNKIYRSK